MTRPPHPGAVYAAGERFVSEQACRWLAKGFGEQTVWFVRDKDPENAKWAATHAAHYARLAIERRLEEQ